MYHNSMQSGIIFDKMPNIPAICMTAVAYLSETENSTVRVWRFLSVLLRTLTHMHSAACAIRIFLHLANSRFCTRLDVSSKTKDMGVSRA